MSYLTDLFETKIEDSDLIPLSHSTANAQIEILIDYEGEFLEAKEIPVIRGEYNHVTIIPVTEDSASRGSGVSPHPLHDKLEYIACDFRKFYSELKGEKPKRYLDEKYNAYVKELTAFASSEFATPEVVAVYRYIKKGNIVANLIEQGILKLKEGILTNDKIDKIDQRDCFIRFSVEAPFTLSVQVYKHQATFSAFEHYYNSIKSTSSDLCYVTGEKLYCTTKHSAKIRNTADKAKLISSNDNVGFTYRGKFLTADQALSTSYYVSEQIHRNLRYLIKKQGFVIADLTVVCWEKYNKPIISPMLSTQDSFFQDDDDCELEYNTNESYANKIRMKANGYYADLETKSEIVVLALESATVGRLAVSLYQKFNGSDFYESLKMWHETCFWRYLYKKYVNKKNVYHWVVGAPAPIDIAKACFGDKNESVLMSTVSRLIPCIINKKIFPKDLMKSALMRSANPHSFETKLEFDRQVSITCAVIRKVRLDYHKEDYTMGLDPLNTDRNYLFGRLLAAAQMLEDEALEIDEKRPTAAERFMSQYTKTPTKTIAIIENCLIPYKQKLKASGKIWYERNLREIYDLFSEEDFKCNSPLNELYLLGYNCQLNSYYKKNVGGK